MPYIDFCFMLIIIFVGMLSIAYFEPLGTTDIESRHTKKVDSREGQFNKNPLGIQQENMGSGDEQPSEVVYPLVPVGGLKADGNPVVAADKGNRVDKPGGKDLDASKEEVEKLKKLLEAKEEELKKLKENETVQSEGERSTESEDDLNQEKAKKGKTENIPGNHYYIDLRNN
mgnify:CR=1 FL=1